MASAYGFEMKSTQGVIFALNINAKRDRIQTFGDWEAELRARVPFLCARTEKPNSSKPIMDLITEAHAAAEQMLDIVAVEERVALLCVEPHNNVAWRMGPNGLKVELTSAITFSSESSLAKATVTDAHGNVIPDPPYVAPPFHASYRYFVTRRRRTTYSSLTRTCFSRLSRYWITWHRSRQTRPRRNGLSAH